MRGDQPGALVPFDSHAFPARPGGRRLPWSGILGATVGALLAVALVSVGVVAVARDGERIAVSRQAEVTEGGGSGSVEYNTSAGSGSSAARASTGTGGATAGSTGSGTGSSGGSDPSGGGGAGGGGDGGGGAGGKVLRPPAGHYPITGSGTEKTKGAPGAPEAWRDMDYEVRHRGDGCFEIEVRFHPFHRSFDRYCPTSDGGLIVTMNVTYTEVELIKGWETIKVNTTSTCDPPEIMVRAGMQPGESWSDHCLSETDNKQQAPGVTRQDNTMTFIGIEEVAGVSAYRIRQDQVLSPASADSPIKSGTGTADTWFSTENGLVLRVTRSSSVVTASIIGDVTYTEVGEFTLTAATPR
ncbi:MAG: hypothetical protein IT198_07305 [Acidimicrobiia bacterium]|nr:hypothetical protein [Acidimicrobiia bacterium]